MAARLVLFVDYQNFYRDARRAFFDEADFHTKGQFDPINLGKRICERRADKGARELEEVRVYTGLPASSKDPRGYGARRRQVAYWEQSGIVVKPRILRYPHDWPDSDPQEKGVDVALAVDFVAMAVEGRYDVGVIASTDTDLRPAIEYVSGRGGVIVETAAWWGNIKKELAEAASGIWCHRLDRQVYDLVCDLRDYNLKS